MSEQQPDPDVDGTPGPDTDDDHLDPTNPDSDPDGINPSDPHPSETNRPNEDGADGSDGDDELEPGRDDASN